MKNKRTEEERRKANKVDLGVGISRRPSPAELKRSQQEKEAEELREKLAEQERQQGIDWLKAKVTGDTRNFLQWLAAQRNQEPKPVTPPPLAKVQQDVEKNKPYKCNQWLFVEYFDKEQKNLKALVDEWLRIRREQDFKEPPVKPLQSMRTAINEEKERRKNRNRE